MDRRNFIKSSGVIAGAFALEHGIFPVPVRLLAAEMTGSEDNPNLADPKRGAKATASSHSDTPTWGYLPDNTLGDLLQTSWETEKETTGAWLEVAFAQEQTVQEIWILAKPHPYDLMLDPYMRGGKMATPRKITCSTPGGGSVRAELRQTPDFQIVAFPQPQKTKSVRITINDVWPEASTEGTGLGKVRVFGRCHAPAFEISVYTMYDARDGMAVQSATLDAINPGPAVSGASLKVSHAGTPLAAVPLGDFAAQSVSRHNIWIPAPFEDQAFEFQVADAKSAFKATRKLRVPAYHSYFDGGTFDLFTTNHNDLGWLDTQKVTADYRSAEIILPAIELLKQYPDFRYSMECVAYLMEFLDRHPEKREEIAQLTREKKMVWGGSYVENLEGRVGLENLVRQFYLGRRWLHKNFPGCDSIHYCKTDPPGMSWQMPQILTKAGIKYAIQGRFPWGFYNWVGPDGSRTFVFAFRYADPHLLPNPKGNQGWLSFAAEREDYYKVRHLPPQMIFDFNGDYLPPPPSLVPYVPEQNAAMQRFAEKWNEHYAGEPSRQIKPPVLRFVEAEGMLDDLTKHELNIDTVKGEWPINWPYYDEPGHRAGLLAGRLAHNRLLAAERIGAGLLGAGASTEYPAKAFEEAWLTNCWPDHGWGGNRGTVTDSVYIDMFVKSKNQADKLLADATASLAKAVPAKSADVVSLAIFNPLGWKRTDAVRAKVDLPAAWSGFTVRDGAGKEVPCQTVGGASGSTAEIEFVGEDVPSLGYKTYYLEQAAARPPRGAAATGTTLENAHLRAALGAGGLKSLYDKRLKLEVLKTDKFFGGEVLQFTAPGFAWDDKEIVTTQDFDKTSRHDFRVVSFEKGPVSTTVAREAKFAHFRLRQSFRLYAQLDRLETEVDILDWDGPKARELRVAFPIDLPQDYRLSYEVPFGTVEIGKDEIDFTNLPGNLDCQFVSSVYGGDRPLPFREAINWIDASSDLYQKYGCLAASDCTVHLFRDETESPVAYPVLQHVLLSTRKSQAWNPDYWFTQAGSYHYRMALYPHAGGWRERYRDGVAFNYPLLAVAAAGGGTLPAAAEFLCLEPANLVMTAFKKFEDDDSVALRFFEAEGRANNRAHVKLAKPIQQAWKTNLIEEEPEPLTVNADGTVELDVKPWEIVTLKLQV
jgi:alpha-mannosidase